MIFVLSLSEPLPACSGGCMVGLSREAVEEPGKTAIAVALIGVVVGTELVGLGVVL